MTRDEALTFLLRHGCEEPGPVLAEAQRFPGNWSYTPDRHAAVKYRMPAGTWNAADTRESEEAIKRARHR